MIGEPSRGRESGSDVTLGPQASVLLKLLRAPMTATELQVIVRDRLRCGPEVPDTEEGMAWLVALDALDESGVEGLLLRLGRLAEVGLVRSVGLDEAALWWPA